MIQNASELKQASHFLKNKLIFCSTKQDNLPTPLKHIN